MKNILIGIMDSNIGGVNRFILDYMEQHMENKYIILSNAPINEVYSFEMRNSIIEIIPSALHPINLYKRTKDILRNIQIDSVYLNISTNLLYPILKAAADCGIRERIVHSHSSYSADVSFVKRSVIVAINMLLRKRVNKLATVRKACSDKAANWLFGKNSDYEFVYNRVNRQKFAFDIEKRQKYRRELALESSFIIGFVGGFNYQKNISYFFDIAKRLRRVRNDFCIVMIGDGELKSAFETKLEHDDIRHHFRLVGAKANANDYYNMFDCFVMPSRFEGLPIVGIEAQVNGLKCFFSDRITTQVLITEEAEVFNLSGLKQLVKSISKLQIGNHIVTPKDEFKNFVMS